MIQLSKKNQTEIEFSIQISGTQVEKTRPRVVLKPEGNSATGILVECSIDGTGLCKATLPALHAFQTPKGNLSVEVIAEDNYFTVYESEFDIETDVAVQLHEAKGGNFIRVVSSKRDSNPIQVSLAGSNSSEDMDDNVVTFQF
jgi:hypothetical protein